MKEVMYLIELNNFYIGESAKFIKENIPNNFVDLTVTSPPYDDLRKYNGFVFDYKSMLDQLYKVTKDGGVVVWVVGDETKNGCESLTSFKQALYAKEIGFNVETMIWEKQTFTATGALKYRYGQVFEYMYIFSKGNPKHFNPIKDRENKSNGRTKVGSSVRQKDGSTKPMTSQSKTINEFGQRFNIWRINTEVSSKNRFHPAQFPEQLALDHILSWSNEGDVILDPMCGAGTTCKMAWLNRRNFIGIDISEEYINNICIPRLKEYGWNENINNTYSI